MRPFHCHHAGLMALVLVLIAASVFTVDTASAQKKKSTPAAVQSQKAPRAAGMIREVLAGLQGKSTNLGTLTKLAGDYVVFDNDGDTVYYPLSALQSVKVMKPEEEGGESRIEIRFLNRD
jgi:hypothetical protein